MINSVRELPIGPNLTTQWGGCVGSFDKNGDYYIPRVRLGYIRTRGANENNPGERVHGLDIYDGSLRIYGEKYSDSLAGDDTKASLYFKNEDGQMNMYVNGEILRDVPVLYSGNNGPETYIDEVKLGHYSTTYWTSEDGSYSGQGLYICHKGDKNGLVGYNNRFGELILGEDNFSNPSAGFTYPRFDGM
nr:MAG TPA: hypothetical protein [Caudoviricetes sp.]